MPHLPLSLSASFKAPEWLVIIIILRDVVVHTVVVVVSIYLHSGKAFLGGIRPLYLPYTSISGADVECGF